MPNTEPTALPAREAAELDAFQCACVDLFVNAALTLSIPRTIGEIYGLLFSTERELSLDDITARLRISRGGAHEGLKWLRSIGAVRLVYLPGVRKEHFLAETSLRRLAAGFLRDRIEPHLDHGPDRLRTLRTLRSLRSSANSPETAFQKDRLIQLANWYKFAHRTLPVVKTLAGKF